jgi:hypothetical protein
MYCNHCGTQLPTGARYCPSCQGAITEVRRRRVEQQLPLLSALWFAMGALRLFAAFIVFAIASIIIPIIMRQQRQPIPFPIEGLIFAIGILVGFSALLTLAVGWGLHKRQPWGRTLALVVAFLSLFSVPFGTALGIYTLVVLLSTEAGEEWDALSR